MRNEALTTAVYRLFDRSGVLLYVGMSMNPEARIRSHSLRSWYQDIDSRRTVTTWYGDRVTAHAAERAAISAESPLHNIERYQGGEKLSPINLYCSDADQAVWDRAREEADVAGRSLSRHVVAVLREQQSRTPGTDPWRADLGNECGCPALQPGHTVGNHEDLQEAYANSGDA